VVLLFSDYLQTVVFLIHKEQIMVGKGVVKKSFLSGAQGEDLAEKLNSLFLAKRVKGYGVVASIDPGSLQISAKGCCGIVRARMFSGRYIILRVLGSGLPENPIAGDRAVECQMGVELSQLPPDIKGYDHAAGGFRVVFFRRGSDSTPVAEEVILPCNAQNRCTSACGEWSSS
jgi:hypothetical protein